jgi:hypothetical protein
MGCDIHAYIERKPYDEQRHLAKLATDRIHGMFELSAGVCSYNNIEPLYLPRGTPDDDEQRHLAKVDANGIIEPLYIPDDDWWHLAKVDANRAYGMFELLAGVRSYNGIKPLYPPRGIPDDIGWSTQDEYTLRVTDALCDCEGVCTLEQADEWVNSGNSAWYPGSSARITHPDWHTPSWLTADELGEVVSRYIEIYGNVPIYYSGIHAMMAKMNEHCVETRFVFWFDN